MATARRLIILFLSLAIVGSVAACGSEPEPTAPEPQIAPPEIGEAGVLRAGVDLGYPPFAGVDQGVEAGIDVDIAAAIAEQLGLRLELIDVTPEDGPDALNDGRIDIMLGATAITETVLADISTAGSYLLEGPVFFSVVATGSAEPTVTADGLTGRRVGAQQGSQVYWMLEADYGEEFPVAYDTLRDALEALVAGEIDIVAGSAAVGSYIARDLDGVRIVGQYGPAQPLGIGVRKDATELESAVRQVLDSLVSSGVIDTIRNKWLGEFPVLEAAVSGASS
jgi:polar amino acid transport system substrate-binding protein